MLFILNHTHFDPYPYLLQATKHTDCVKCLTKRREINSKKKKKKVGVVENKGWLMHMLKKTRVNFNFSSGRIYVVSLIFKIKMSH